MRCWRALQISNGGDAGVGLFLVRDPSRDEAPDKNPQTECFAGSQPGIARYFERNRMSIGCLRKVDRFASPFGPFCLLSRSSTVVEGISTGRSQCS